MKKKDCPCKKCVFWRIKRDGRRAVKQMIAEDLHAKYVASMGSLAFGSALQVEDLAPPPPSEIRLVRPSSQQTPVTIGAKEKKTNEVERTFNFRAFDSERGSDFDKDANMEGLRAYGLAKSK